MTVKELESTIKSFSYLMATADELKKKIEGMTYKTTSSINPAPSSSTNAFHSKVEDFGNNYIFMKMKYEEKKVELDYISTIINHPSLSDEEKDILHFLATNGSMLSYARKKGIYKSYVYKIKDKALAKLLPFAESYRIIQNAIKNG